MDPNACIQRILDAFRDGDNEELEQAMLDLFNWLKSGGFSPAIPNNFPASVLVQDTKTTYLELRQVENSSEFEFVRSRMYLGDQHGNAKTYRQSHRFLLT
jgi:hypothetical protein